MDMRQNPRMRRQRQMRRVGITVGMIAAVFITIVSFFVMANQPKHQAQNRVTTLAKEQNLLVTPDRYYHIARDNTYTTVVGKNKSQQDVGVIMTNNSSKLATIKMADGISEARVRAMVKSQYPVKKITSLGLGVYKDVPVWQVTFTDKQNNLNYITYQFKDGRVIRAIQNL